MKTLEQIIKTKPVFLNDWKDSKKFGVMCDFEDLYMTKEEYEAEKAPYPNIQAWIENKEKATRLIKEWKGKKVLFASYSYQDYSGDAFVLFCENGKLFEVNGSHCSCYGLEGQWTPEEVVLKELENRITVGTFGKDSYCGNEFNSELRTFLGLF